MCVRHRDADAALLKPELSQPMLDHHIRRPEALNPLASDLAELRGGHGLVRGVLDPRHRSPRVHVAYDPEEYQDGTKGRAARLIGKDGRVDANVNQPSGGSHPPA